jgi:DNA-binding NarL/FixJ family response regulator
VAGEPGIGKTALLAEGLARARARGYRSLYARAAEFESHTAFALVTDALGLPELELDLTGAVGAARRALEDAAAESRLVLALDDLHWADAGSIDLVCHLLHRGFDGPVLLLLASRPAQTEARLLTAIEDANRHELARLVDLAPLSPAESARLLGEEFARPVREALHRESGGNPFYLEQLAAAHRRGAAEAPTSVSASIRQEVAALPGSVKRVVEAAAVAGDPFEPELVAAIAELPEADVLDALDALLAEGLARALEAPRQFRFRHPIVRRAIYEATGAGWRLAAHGRAAAALEERGAPDSARAHHVERSARVGDEGAIALLTRVAEETAAAAPTTAAHWFDAALRLLPHDAETERRLGLLVRRVAALGIAGALEENRETLRAFLQLAPAEGELRLEAAVLTATLDDLLGRQSDARDLLSRELAALPDPRSRAAAELNRALAFSHFPDADWEAMNRCARASLAADCGGIIEVGALSARALAELGLGQVRDARRTVAEAAALFDRLGADEVAMRQGGVTVWLGWAEICCERFADAARHLERAGRVAAAGARRPETVGLFFIRGHALAYCGRVAEMGDVVESAVEAALLTTSDIFLCWAMTQRCALDLLRGDLQAAVRSGERSVALRPAAASPLTDLAPLRLAEALLAVGEPAAARPLLTAGDAPIDLGVFPLSEAHRYELLVRAALGLGEQDLAAELADRGAEQARRSGLNVPLVHALRGGARVALEAGRAVQAAEAAMAAVDAAEEVAAPIEAERSRILAASALAASGSREQAVRGLRLAHDRLASLGAIHDRDQAARALRGLGHAVPSAAQDSVAGLTRRELEVIELVADGRTNREIAAALVLSPRTIDRHVSRIFEKLGVSSRAAAVSRFERARASP